jgi:hypothetical protein
MMQSVDGIGPKRRERIAPCVAAGEASPRNHAIPPQHGVSTSRAVRIFKTYGERAIEGCARSLHTGGYSRQALRDPTKPYR